MHRMPIALQDKIHFEFALLNIDKLRPDSRFSPVLVMLGLDPFRQLDRLVKPSSILNTSPSP